MENVYVLSGREFVGNNEWGYGCDEISIYGVYSDFETAKEAFKNKVLETAQSLANMQDIFLPQNDSFDYGFWFLPCVNLRKYELK